MGVSTRAGWSRSCRVVSQASWPGSDSAVPVAPPAAPVTLENPYKGLRAFQEADAPDFFGREVLTARMVARLAEDVPLARFLVVVVVLGLLGLGPLADASARAQEPDRGPAASATGVGSARVTDGGDEADGSNPTELDGSGGTSRFNGREPFLKWMIDASGPIGLVIALTLNHEGLTPDRVASVEREYEARYGVPTCDPLLDGCEKLVNKIRSMT